MAASPFVTTAWLAEHLHDPDLIVVDGSWYLPPMKRDARGEYNAGHIPGAVFFDIDAVADTTTSLPHMLPSANAFAAAVSALGIAETMHIVVYDGAGLFSAPRVRWTFKVFGAARVSLLEGGLPAWTAEGRPLVAGESSSHPTAHFNAVLDSKQVASAEQVRQTLETGTAQVVDARAAARFRGEAPEPRAGLRAGHMPGSLNLPFDRLVADGRLVGPEVVAKTIAEAGIAPDGPVVATCGSGLTAAVVALALESVGRPDTVIYDGSWAEWGGRADLPFVTGA